MPLGAANIIADTQTPNKSAEHTNFPLFFLSLSLPIRRHVRTIPRRGRQTLCHQYQSGDILNERLIQIVNAKTSNQIRHLLDKLGERSVPSSTTQTSPSPTELGRRVHSASGSVTLFSTPSPSPPPPSVLLLEQLSRRCLHKRTPLSSVHSTPTGKIAAASAADNRKKTHASDGDDVHVNCINASDNIDWYIQLASKCYADGFLSHVKHLDECTRPRGASAIETKLQRQHQHSSSTSVGSHPRSRQRQTQRRIRRPLKPLRSTNLFSCSSQAVHSAANDRDDEHNANRSNWCDSLSICDSRRCSGAGGAAHQSSAAAHADDTMNRGAAAIDANSAQGLQQQHWLEHNPIDDQNSNRFVYADDHRMNISPTTANRVNDLINSFYTLKLTAAADDISLPQIILTDFSNNSLQPTTTPLFLSATENRSSFVSAAVPNGNDDTATAPSHQQPFVADDFHLPERKSQLQFTFNDAHFAASPNYYQYDSNGARSFDSN